MKNEQLIRLQELQNALKENPKSEKIYESLGDLYCEININQAYLCYEHGLLYCQVDNNLECFNRIKEKCSNLQKLENFRVKKAAIVILSYNSKKLIQQCIESIINTSYQSEYEIIVVDNASDKETCDYLKGLTNIKLQLNNTNAGFPKGCNQGIELADLDSDIFLLNNDVIMTTNGLFMLRMSMYENDKVGACGSITNYASNGQMLDLFSDNDNEITRNRIVEINNSNLINGYINKSWLVGFCLLLNRKALHKVGLLDERFSPGNFEDNDICIRIGKAGYSVRLCYNSYVTHLGSQSFGKDVDKYTKLINTNRGKFMEKWGFEPEKSDEIMKIAPDENRIRNITERQFYDFYNRVYAKELSKHIERISALLKKGDKTALKDVFNFVNEPDTMIKFRVSPIITLLVILLSIYENESSNNIENHIFSKGKTLEEVCSDFNELKFALWRVEFFANEASEQEFIEECDKQGASYDYIIHLIETSAMDKFNCYFTIGALYKMRGQVLVALRLYMQALKINENMELLLCEIADIYMMAGKNNEALNYVSKIKNPTDCTVGYLNRWENPDGR